MYNKQKVWGFDTINNLIHLIIICVMRIILSGCLFSLSSFVCLVFVELWYLDVGYIKTVYDVCMGPRNLKSSTSLCTQSSRINGKLEFTEKC